MKKSLIILIFLSSCSNLTLKKERYPSSTNSDNKTCAKVVYDFGNTHLKFTSSKYSEFNGFQNSINFIQEERKLESAIENWMSIGNRSISVEQMRHHGAYSKIASSFDIDTPYIISKSFESLYKQIETSYFISKRFISKAKDLRELRDLLKDTTEITSEMKIEIERFNNDIIIDAVKISSDDIQSLKASLDTYEDQINSTIIEESIRVLNSFEQYKVTREFLDKKLINPQDADKAKSILEKLETNKLLSSCDLCSEGQILTRPSIQNIEDLIKNVKIAKIIYLRRQLWSERLMSISSRLPNNALYYIADIILQKLPKLNKSGFRKFLRSKVVDFRDITKHFPNIDRIIFSKASVKDLAILTKDISAQSNDIEFLVTFARRVDAHDKWNIIYKFLKENAPTEPNHQDRILFENMEKAWLEATNRGPLPEWHAPEKSTAIRFVIDTLFLGYVSYNTMDVVNNSIEEVEDITGIDIIKENEILESVDEEAIRLEHMIEKDFDDSNIFKNQEMMIPESSDVDIKSNKNLFEM